MSSGAPPPARRILPDVPISEQGLRQLEIWLLGQMRSVVKEAARSGIFYDILNKGDWLSVETIGFAPDAAGDVNRDGTPQGIQLIATNGSVLIEGKEASADGHGVKILDHSNQTMLIESEDKLELSGASGGSVIVVNDTSGDITIAPNSLAEVNMTRPLDMETHQIHNVVDPTSDQDAATKKYVDDEIAGVGTGIQFGITNTGSYLVVETTSATGGVGISLHATGTAHDIEVTSDDGNLTFAATTGQASFTLGGGFFVTTGAGAATQIQSDNINLWPQVSGGKVTIFDSDGTTVLAEWTAT